MVLQVAVHDHDVVAFGIVQPGGDSIVLSEVTTEVDALDLGVACTLMLYRFP